MKGSYPTTLMDLLRSGSFNMAVEMSSKSLSAATISTDPKPFSSKTFLSVYIHAMEKNTHIVCLYSHCVTSSTATPCIP